MKKRPSSIDVARLANVSQATVSYVLRGRADKSISEVTRERVMQAAQELGYLPNRLTDGILRGKTQTIGVLLPDFSHSFIAMVMMGLETAFGESGYRMLIAHNRNDPELEHQQVRMLLEQRVDGIVAVTDELTVEHLGDWVSEAKRAGVPICIVDDLRMEGELDTVVSDDLLGGQLAVRHLADLGHKRIACLGGGNRASSSRLRLEGYKAALKEHGLHFDPALVIDTTYHLGNEADLGPLLQLSEPPTAVFAFSDGLLCQALAAMHERNDSRADGLATVGYGNLEWSRYMSLTTVEQSPLEMGRTAAARVIARLDGESGPPVTEVLAPELVIRNSSKKRTINGA